MKKALSLIFVLVLSFTLFACGESSEKTRVIALKGPTGMGMVKLFDNEKYQMTLLGSPDEAVAEIVSGRFDIASVPTNLAATLYKKTNGRIKVLALNTLGVLYVLENGNEIKSFKDLEGKKIGMSGQGSTPEFIFNYLVSVNNLKNVEMEFYTEHAELMTALLQGSVSVAVLPEPNVTTTLTKSDNIRIALNLTEEWEKLGGSITQGCIVISDEFANDRKAVSDFLGDVRESVDFVNKNSKEAAEKIAENGIVPSSAVAEKAIPNCNICLITGYEMEEILNGFLKVLYEADPKSVGGNLPDEGFIYK